MRALLFQFLLFFSQLLLVLIVAWAPPVIVAVMFFRTAFVFPVAAVVYLASFGLGLLVAEYFGKLDSGLFPD